MFLAVLVLPIQHQLTQLFTLQESLVESPGPCLNEIQRQYYKFHQQIAAKISAKPQGDHQQNSYSEVPSQVLISVSLQFKILTWLRPLWNTRLWTVTLIRTPQQGLQRGEGRKFPLIRRKKTVVSIESKTSRHWSRTNREIRGAC